MKLMFDFIEKKNNGICMLNNNAYNDQGCTGIELTFPSSAEKLNESALGDPAFSKTARNI